ncbi:MAG: calcium/proton exchanger [Planctomycetota bacterium]|nr:calcium/proton exchanger [Planctomycetota bacterium]
MAVSPTARRFKIDPLQLLLVAIPIACVLRFTGCSPVWVFIASCVAVIPLAGLMGKATENLAETLGAGIGGLLNATFGNAAELIIALAALFKGPQMYPIIKASLTGSIIGNVLLVLGLSMFAGGVKFRRQTFNRTAAGLGATMLALASVGLILPTIYHYLVYGVPGTLTAAASAAKAPDPNMLDHLSEEIAVVLFVTYLLSLFFSLKTHQHLFAGDDHDDHGSAATPAAATVPDETAEAPADHHPEWSRRFAIGVLVAATVGVAVMSEFLVGSVEEAAHSLGMSSVFVGVIVVAIIGNAAEHSTAVLVAMKNKMDLAVNIAVGSSLQIALFVAPVLVFVSMFMGYEHPLDLHFTPMEVVAVVISILVLAMVCSDGESHWMEGVMLLAVYVMLALAFFNLPDAAGERGEESDRHRVVQPQAQP